MTSQTVVAGPGGVTSIAMATMMLPSALRCSSRNSAAAG